MISEHSFSWKSKSPPLSNEFLLDAIQTFQGYQFRFHRKKKKILLVWQEISMRSWGTKRKPKTGWDDWAFNEYLKNLLSCQRKEASLWWILIYANEEVRERRERKIYCLRSTFTCCRVLSSWPKVLLWKGRAWKGRGGERRENSVKETQKVFCIKPHIFPDTVPFFYYLTCFRKRGKGFCEGKRKIEFYFS